MHTIYGNKDAQSKLDSKEIIGGSSKTTQKEIVIVYLHQREEVRKSVKSCVLKGK